MSVRGSGCAALALEGDADRAQHGFAARMDRVMETYDRLLDSPGPRAAWLMVARQIRSLDFEPGKARSRASSGCRRGRRARRRPACRRSALRAC